MNNLHRMSDECALLSRACQLGPRGVSGAADAGAEEFFGGHARTFLPAAHPVLIIPECKPDWPSPLLLPM